MMPVNKSFWCCLVTLQLATSGCAANKIPEHALRLPESSMEVRAIQTRRFEVSSHTDILNATISALQDMEYNIDALDQSLGIITASKVSDADSASDSTGRFMLDVLCALGGSGGCNSFALRDDKFAISMTMVVLPSLDVDSEFITRITLQRALISKAGTITNLQRIDDAQIYSDIFVRLSKSLYLEENTK
jgi:hypothetical protein